MKHIYLNQMLRNSFKSALALCLFICLSFVGLAQSVGDYRTKGNSNGDGNWNDPSIWETRTALPDTWEDATEYPGESPGVGLVILSQRDDILITEDVPNPIGQIDFEAGGRTITLTFDDAFNLEVTGSINFSMPSGRNDQRLYVDAGTLSCASINMTATSEDRSDQELRITTGEVTVSGDVTMLGVAAQNVINFNAGGGVLNIGGSMTGGSFDRQNGSGSTVNFNGTSGSQTMDTYTFENIVFSGDAQKVLSADINVDVSCTVNSNLYCANFIVADAGNSVFTLNSGATLGIGSVDGITTAGTAAGNIQLDTRNYDAAANYIYNGAGAQITGSGLPATVNELTVNNIDGLTLSNAVVVSSALNMTNGNLSLVDNNITVADGAVISGAFDNTHMILTEGTGSLIKQGTVVSEFNMVYPVGTGTDYTPMLISNTAGSPTGTADISVRVVNQKASAAQAIDLLRHWVVDENNISSLSCDVSFSFIDPDDVAGNIAAYEIQRYDTGSGLWVTPNNPGAAGSNPLVSTSTNDLKGEWTAREPITAWYSFKSGNWNNWECWTLDPSGATRINDGNYYPQAITDKVVVKDGREITMNVDNHTCDYLTVDGTLYMGTSTGNTFSKIFGSGRIYMQADNFPIGDATHFVTENQGEGTVVFTGDNYELNTAYTFYDVEVSMNAADRVLTMLNDMSINGNLNVIQGVLRINDNDVASTNVLNLTVEGNVDVLLNGSITVGEADVKGAYSIGGDNMPASGQYHSIFHQFVVKGNFTNRGTVNLTNESAPRYDEFTDVGAVTLRFEGAANNQMQLYGTTNLYNLVIDKGVDKTYQLELYADNASYFTLFGPNNVGRNESSPYSSSEPEIRKALFIEKGTLKLTGSIHIPSLSEGNAIGGNGDYAIGANSKLIIAGADVYVYSTAENMGQIPGYEASAVGVEPNGSHSAMSLFGGFQIEDGYFDTRNSFGFVYWASANSVIEINGGEVVVGRVYQVGTGTSSYLQTAGKVTLTASHFDLSSADGVFHMSGGEIEVRAGDFIVGSSVGNYNVTGGTLTFELNNDRTLNSTANLYNLVINRRTGSDRVLNLATPLVALNDVYVNPSTFLNHNGNDVTIGRDFIIDKDATNIARGGGINYDKGYEYGGANNNTTTFDGTEDGVFHIGYNPTTDTDITWEQVIANVVVNKPKDKQLLIRSDVEKEAANTVDYRCRILRVAGGITVNSGILNQGKQAIRLYGAIQVDSIGQLGVYEDAITDPFALVMLKDDGNTLSTQKGAVLGNIKFNAGTNILDLTSDVYIKRIDYRHGRFNMGAHNLKVDYIDDSNSGEAYTAARKMFISDGLASDGGLSLLVSENSTMLFPIGQVNKYTPVSMTVTGFTDADADSYVTIRTVKGELKTSNLGGDELLDYYWRVGHTGFTTLPTVQYVFTYDDADVAVVGDDALYYPGKVSDESPYTRSYEDLLANVNEGTNEITFNDTRTTSGGSIVSDTGTGFELENANYTAGVANRFTGAVRVFYTRYINNNAYNVKWTNTDAWTFGTNASYDKHDSRQISAGDVPGAGDVAVIGWIPWTDVASLSAQYGLPHGVAVDNSPITCAEVVFDQMKDAVGNPVPRQYRYNFQFRPTLCINGSGSLNAGIVRGEGMFWNRHGDIDMTTMDLGEFAANDSSYVVYEFSDPGAGGVRDLSNTPALFPNLMVAAPGWGSWDRNVRFTKDIETNGNFEILGDANVILSNTAEGDFTIGRDLLMFESNVAGNNSGGGAEFVFPNSTSNRVVTVGRDIILANSGNHVYVESPDGSALDHEIRVSRNISQTATGTGLQLWTDNNNDRITLYLEGSADMTFDIDAGNTPELYRLVINKGIDVTTTATFNSAFNLNGPTSGGGMPKALELNSGNLILNTPGLNINLTTGDDYFDLPSTASIEIHDGVVNATGNSGINLDSRILIAGGSLNMDGGENSIIYSGSGNAELNISQGSLIVGGQIRRTTGSEIGILKYYQSNATTVRVGTSGASTNNRGVFEVLGAGSVFVHQGGTLSIERAQNTPSVAALYLDPEISTLSEGTKISLGGASTPATQNIGINSSISLANLEIDNSSGNNPSVTINVRPLVLDEDLIIAYNTLFDASGLDLTIGGDFTNGGRASGESFVSNSNTTYFNGSATQVINGNTLFFNAEKLGSQDLSLNSGNTEIEVANNFSFEGGQLIDNGNTLTIKGNVQFDGTHVSSNANGIGVMLAGSIAQSLEGSGTFDILTINNLSGVNVPLGNQFSIDGKLRLQKGVFNIDKNLLVLSKNSSIIPVTAFSANNMIQTNISFTDNGVRKYLDTGATNFIYPMGAGGKYTPVDLRVDTNTSSTGYITVKAADEYHPSVVDPTNVLDFHWILKSSDLSGFTGELRMKYEPADVNLNGHLIGEYITARLLADGSGDWNKTLGYVNQPTNELVFDLTDPVTHAEITGDYTAGVADAIPEKVPTYISINVTPAPWNVDTTWDTYPTPGGYVPAGGPRGSMVIVDTHVTIPSDGISSYQTTINGTLEVGDTYAHRLGDVDGTGTLTVQSGTLPAGVYDNFVSSSGGTLEFTGAATDYSILGDLTSVNNLVLSGSGERRLSTNDLTIQGDLTLSGADLINQNDIDLTFKGNMYFNSGTFDAGSNDATSFFSGSQTQDIDGVSDLVGTNGFNNLTVNNALGLSIKTNVDVENVLTLTNGVVQNIYGNSLSVTNNNASAIDGGSSSAYVQGPLTKMVNNGATFSFPIGDGNRYGSVNISSTSTGSEALWTAEYFNNDAALDGKDTDSQVAPLAYVSKNEYWRIQGPASSSARVQLRWDAASGVTPDGNFRMVDWNDLSPSANAWDQVAINAPDTDNKTVSSNGLISFNEFAGEGNYFTFGSILVPAYDWTGTTNTSWFEGSNWGGGTIPVAGSDVTIKDVANDPIIDNSGIAQVNNLTIDPSGVLTMEEGAVFTINGDMTNNGTFIMKTSTSETSSLLPLGNITGNLQIDFTFDPGRYWYLGHSIDGLSSVAYNAADNNTVLYEYDAGYNKINNNVTAFDVPLKGYVLGFRAGVQVITYVGALRNSSYSLNNLGSTWHLVSNPYTCYVDLALERTNSGAYWTFINLSRKTYVRTDVGAERPAVVYDIDNPVLSHPEASQYIAPMQAFWIKSDGNGTFGVSPQARKHDPGKNVFKSAVVSPSNVMKFTLANGGTYDYTAVALSEEGTTYFSGHDANKIPETGVGIPLIYTKKEGVSAVINVLPMLGEADEIPLYLTIKEAGDLNFKMINVNDFNVYSDVFLKDVVTNEVINLRSQSEYEFTSPIVTDQHRFSILFKDPGVTTNIADKGSVGDTGISIWGDLINGYVRVSDELINKAETDGLIFIYNMNGLLIETIPFEGLKTSFALPNIPGIYIVEARIGDMRKTQKLSKGMN